MEVELNEFSLNSGLKVNKDKCTISRVNKTMSPVNEDVFPPFQRRQTDFDYIGFNVPFKLEDMWNKNIPPKVDRMFTELGNCSQLSSATVLGRVIVLKSLFFSHLPYFLKLVTLPYTDALSYLQKKLSNVVWNGKKTKMKFSKAVMPVYSGGLGMIDVTHRYHAIKVNLKQRALYTLDPQFWQLHLFSFFSIPFDLLIRCNLSQVGFSHFVNKPLPKFWKETFDIWIKFHYAHQGTKGNEEQILEFLSRPIVYIGVFGYNLAVKRYTLEINDWYNNQHWFSVIDALSATANDIPCKGFVSKNQA